MRRARGGAGTARGGCGGGYGLATICGGMAKAPQPSWKQPDISAAHGRGPPMKSCLVALTALCVVASVSTASGQCCGDCDQSGDVSIAELIGSVNNALASCVTAFQPVIGVRGVALPGFAATLRAPVAEGRLAVELETDWAGTEASDRFLFAVKTPNTFANRVELIKNGEFLRWIVAEASGREVDLNVRIATWQPGIHTIEASWADGRMQLSIDGVRALEGDVGAVAIDAGADVLVGEQGAPGTTVREVTFATRAP